MTYQNLKPKNKYIFLILKIRINIIKNNSVETYFLIKNKYFNQRHMTVMKAIKTLKNN